MSRLELSELSGEEKAAMIRASGRVSLDFETTGENALIPYLAVPEGGAVGWEFEGQNYSEYWSFDIGCERGYNRVSWRWFEEQILRPVWEDPNKTFIFHHYKFDAQVALRQLYRGKLKAGDFRGALPKGIVEDTMLISFLLNENTPVGLKELSKTHLNKPRKSFEAVNKEMKGIKKLAFSQTKSLLKEAWELYKKSRWKSSKIEEDIPPDTSYFDSLVLSCPPKMKKADFEATVRVKIEPLLVEHFTLVAENKFAEYAIDDAMDTMRVWKKIYPKLYSDKRLLWHYRQIEIPFNEVLLEAEALGISINRDLLGKMEIEVRHLLDTYQKRIVDLAVQNGMPENFNSNSHVQVKQLVWDKLKLTAPDWAVTGKDGKKSTNAEVLNYLAEKTGNEVCSLMAASNGVSNLYNTYIKAILERSGRNVEGRERTSFKSFGAVTGRISSSPNMQNITNARKMPKVPKTFLGYNGNLPSVWKDLSLDKDRPEPGMIQLQALREVFTAPPGWKLLVGDYSQIELRMVAEITQDPVMVDAYCKWRCKSCGGSGYTKVAIHSCPRCGEKEGKLDKMHPEQPVIEGFVLGKDLHSLTALGCGILDRPGGRNDAKEINFGLTYGMNWRTLMHKLSCSEEEARSYYNNYFKTYKKVLAWHMWTKKHLLQKGEFDYLFGRKRRFHSQRTMINSGLSSKWQVNEAVREALNNIPQGSAGDIMKLGANRFYYRKLDHPEVKECYMPLNVHDEVVIMCREEAVDETKKVLIECMEWDVGISIPIIFEVHSVDNWAQAK